MAVSIVLTHSRSKSLGYSMTFRTKPHSKPDPMYSIPYPNGLGKKLKLELPKC